MQILHAPVIGLYQVGNLVEISHQQGWKSDSMVWNLHGAEGLYRHVDMNLQMQWTSSPPESIEFRPLEFLLETVFEYDIFHFHYGYSLLPLNYQLIPGRKFPPNLDLRMIRDMGKKIVFHHWSCFAGRHDGFWRQDWPVCGPCRATSYCYCKADYVRVLRDREIEFADLQINGHPDLEDLLPGKSHHLPISIDLDFFDEKSSIPPEFLVERSTPDTVLVIHSFNDRGKRGDVKGTCYIKQAIDNLKSKGVPIELLYFDDIPNSQIAHYQWQADIAVDQLLFPWHGSTGMECMAAGKPVVSLIDEEWKKAFHPDLPIVNANPETIEQVLLDLVENPRKREEIGRRSREYVEQTHSFSVVGQQLATLYEKLMDD